MTAIHGSRGEGSPQHRPMNDTAFRALLDFIMADDPRSFPYATDLGLMQRATEEAIKRGYDGWPAAYHEFKPESPSTLVDRAELVDELLWMYDQHSCCGSPELEEKLKAEVEARG